MVRMNLKERTITIPVDVRLGGGVIDGQLLSLYRCPKCHEDLRFIAVFESPQVAQQALENIGDLSRKMELARSGRAVVGTATYMSMYGPRTHGGASGGYGYYSSYGRGCALLPYYGTQRELAREIWEKLHKDSQDGVPPLPPVRLDLARLQGIAWAEDQLNPENLPLLLYEGQLLHSPADVIVGSWDTRRERHEDWRRRLENGPHLFLQKASLQTPTV